MLAVFTANDMSRMFALQYIMALVATMDCEQYFSRNEKLKSYIEGYNDNFPQGAEILERLVLVTRFIGSINLGRESRWFKKANLFSLIIELDKYELATIDPKKLGKQLVDFDFRATMNEFQLAEKGQLTSNEEKYLTLAREAVNEKGAREYRGEFLRQFIEQAKI